MPCSTTMEWMMSSTRKRPTTLCKTRVIADENGTECACFTWKEAAAGSERQIDALDGRQRAWNGEFRAEDCRAAQGLWQRSMAR